MRWLLDVVYLLAAFLYLPVALYNAIVLGKNRSGWGERFGNISIVPSTRPRIWVHAVSLGEINATPTLVRALQEKLPEVEIVFSSTTDTGYARAVQWYGAGRVFRFPLDFSWVVTRVLNHVRPAMIVLMELEVWPNLTRAARASGIPVAVVNGRLTQRSARRLRRLGGPVRAMFADLAWVGAQDETIASRFRELGTPPERIEITSSLKWDTAVTADRVDGDEGLARALGLEPSRPLWVCGSTGPGEEAILLCAYREVLSRWGDAPPPALVVVPRKPERFEEVARLMESSGFVCIRRSARPDGTTSQPLDGGAVVLGDTMGELRKFYALADLVFAGRSLVPMGGSDPMEAAALGKPILTGPYVSNFDQPVRALQERGALCVMDSAESLAEKVLEWLKDDSALCARGARAREVVKANQGATLRTAARLVDLFEQRGSPDSPPPTTPAGIGPGPQAGYNQPEPKMVGT